MLNRNMDSVSTSKGCKWRGIGYCIVLLVLGMLGSSALINYVGNTKIGIGIALFTAVCIFVVVAKLVLVGFAVDGREDPANNDNFPEVVVSEDVSHHVASIVAKRMMCSTYKAQRLIQRLNKGVGIAHLIRYEEALVGNWSPEHVRNFQKLFHVVQRAEYIKQNLAASNQLNEQVIRDLDSAQTLPELDEIYKLYKVQKAESPLSRLKNPELFKTAAEQILDHQPYDIRNLVSSHHELTKTLEDVRALLSDSIAETILKQMFDTEWRNNEDWIMKSSKIPNAKVVDAEKFEKFYDFHRPIRGLGPEKVLAMNRGENKNILKVTLMPGNSLEVEIQQTMNRKFGVESKHDHYVIMDGAITKAQSKLITKLSKKVRSDMIKSAEDTAIEVFCSNFKRLLLTPPFRSVCMCHVLGIDPGLQQLKTVIVNSKSLTLESSLIVDLSPNNYFEQSLINILKKWRVEIIVVGNGVGSPKILEVVSNIIRIPEFSGIRHTVIREHGVSEYSVTAEAELEYPDLEPKIISSICLVKRLFDPLNEYLKMDPRRLGIGMYQHDIDDIKLKVAVQETVTKVVSIIGVDLNTASVPLLKSVPGLTLSRANAIVTHRNNKGPFKNKNQLREVIGIDEATFRQCAGFVRIIPPSNVVNKSEYNLLEQTMIRPEHYKEAHELLGLMGLSINNIGTSDFTKKVRCFTSVKNMDKFSKQLGVDIYTTKLLMCGLSQDMTLAVLPDLKSHLCTIDELHINMVVLGQVVNVTTVEAFVDIGVGGKNGVLRFENHYKPDIGLGDTIEAVIHNLEVNRGRIELKFKRKIFDLLTSYKC